LFFASNTILYIYSFLSKLGAITKDHFVSHFVGIIAAELDDVDEAPFHNKNPYFLINRFFISVNLLIAFSYFFFSLTSVVLFFVSVSVLIVLIIFANCPLYVSIKHPLISSSFAFTYSSVDDVVVANS
jgi:hypothetical protein